MHHITVEPCDDGYRIHRPGWPDEYLEDAWLAERLAESLAHEFHVMHGRPARAVHEGGQRVIACFGADASEAPGPAPQVRAGRAAPPACFWNA